MTYFPGVGVEHAKMLVSPPVEFHDPDTHLAATYLLTPGSEQVANTVCPPVDTPLPSSQIVSTHWPIVGDAQGEKKESIPAAA